MSARQVWVWGVKQHEKAVNPKIIEVKCRAHNATFFILVGQPISLMYSTSVESTKAFSVYETSGGTSGGHDLLARLKAAGDGQT
jgi:hypothetical protein